MIRFLLLLLFATTSVFSQYSDQDRNLVKTTYTKEFNKEIIEQYLFSETNEKVIAALQTITHSGDTAYVPLITKLDQSVFGKQVAFAIGHLPYCAASVTFLDNKIYSNNDIHFLPDYLEAYGRIGQQKDCDKLLNLLTKSRNKHLTGLSYAIYNFQQRGLIKDFSAVTETLLADLHNSNEQVVFDALFGLARTNAGDSATDKLTTFISDNYKTLSARNLTYALSGLRKVDTLKLSWETIKELLRNKDWRVNVETIRAIEKFPYGSVNEFFKCVELLKDSNPNVARQVAMSLKNMMLNDEIKSILKENYSNLMENEKLSQNVKGELLVSLATLFPDINTKLLTDYNNVVDNNFLFTIIELKSLSPKQALDFLNGKLDSVTQPERMNLFSAYLSWQENFRDDKAFLQNVFNEFKGNDPNIISFLTYLVDSTFVSQNKNELSDIIKAQTESKINNGLFAEALVSFYGIAQNINPELADNMLAQFKLSEVDDLSRFYLSETDAETILRSDKKFDELWENAFKYIEANVTTTEGKFVMKLHPELAPISVGNFNTLSVSGYFNNVIFHRVVPDFVAQVGDPTGTGWGGPGYTINAEFTPTPIAERFVGMASAGPDTEGSQWYILHNDFPHLYGRYTMFAEVINGMDVVDMLDQDSKILSIELKEKAE